MHLLPRFPDHQGPRPDNMAQVHPMLAITGLITRLNQGRPGHFEISHAG